jgi:hypothetical protein
MEHLTTLISRSRFHTEIGFDFVNNFRAIAEADKVDAFIVATEDGFSPRAQPATFSLMILGLQLMRFSDWQIGTDSKMKESLLSRLSRARRGGGCGELFLHRAKIPNAIRSLQRSPMVHLRATSTTT